MVAPPFLHVPIVSGTIRKDVAVGGQNVSLFPNGARTGETSAAMLKDIGASWVIVGHSERREGFGMAGESSELVALKTKVAVSGGLSVMACVGEKLEERDAGKTLEVRGWERGERCARQRGGAKARVTARAGLHERSPFHQLTPPYPALSAASRSVTSSSRRSPTSSRRTTGPRS